MNREIRTPTRKGSPRKEILRSIENTDLLSANDPSTTPLRTLFLNAQSPKARSPTRSMTLSATIESPSVPPAKFVDFEFKRPLLPSNTPRNLIKKMTRELPDLEDKTPRKLINNFIMSSTPLGVEHVRRLDLEEEQQDESDTGRDDQMEHEENEEEPSREIVNKLAKTVTDLQMEVRDLEVVKDTMAQVVEETTQEKLHIQHLARTVQQSDENLASVNTEVRKLTDLINAFGNTLRIKKQEAGQLLPVTSLISNFGLAALVTMSLLCALWLLSNSSTMFSDVPSYGSLNPRPT